MQPTIIRQKNPYIENFIKQTWLSKIANEKRWTISDCEKMPVDMYLLKYRQLIKGADSTVPYSLISLHELYKDFPDATNVAFNLDAAFHNIVILDIEPTCPENIKSQILKIPTIYAETSMSGKGIHMVFDYPEDIIMKYPNAAEKPALKRKDKYYEILLSHYVTFTGKAINFVKSKCVQDQTQFRNIFEVLAREQKPTQRASVDFNLDDIKPVKCNVTEDILKYLMHYADTLQWYIQKHDDLGEEKDNSSFELGYISKLNVKLNAILKISYIHEEITSRGGLTLQEKIWFLTHTATEKLPYRSKHDEFRDGLPWLMYLSNKAVQTE